MKNKPPVWIVQILLLLVVVNMALNLFLDNNAPDRFIPVCGLNAFGLILAPLLFGWIKLGRWKD